MLGAGKPDDARICAYASVVLASTAGFVMALIFLIPRSSIGAMYTSDPILQAEFPQYIKYMAVYFWIECVSRVQVLPDFFQFLFV